MQDTGFVNKPFMRPWATVIGSKTGPAAGQSYGTMMGPLFGMATWRLGGKQWRGRWHDATAMAAHLTRPGRHSRPPAAARCGIRRT